MHMTHSSHDPFHTFVLASRFLQPLVNSSSMLLEARISQQQGAVSTAAPVYQNTPQFSLGRTSTLQENSEERRTPSGSAELMKLPAKRTSSHQFGANEEYNTYKYAPGDRTPIFLQYLQPSNTYANLVPQQYDRSARSYQGHPSRHTGYGYSGPGTTPPPIIMAQSPQVTNWGSYPTVGSSMARSPVYPAQLYHHFRHRQQQLPLL